MRISAAAERGNIKDVVMPHSTRQRTQTSLRSLRKEERALAMLKGKKVEMPARKHDNLPV